MEEANKEFNLRVAEDGATVLLNCDVTTDKLDELVAAIGKELESLGIKDPPDRKQLKKQLHHTAEKDPHLVDFVLIKGKPPVPPQNGRVEWAGDFFNTGFVTDKETGKIDYREKKAHESVTKGTLLARQIPAKEGKDGQDVFGKSIPVEEPVTYYPEIGGNVRFDESENTYYAEKNGRVRLVNNILYIDEVYTIEEDVDIATGNISHTGAVVVNRDVLNDAKVEAEGNIEVHGIIENAEIRTDGDLTAHGGIRQSEGHKIVVKGGINTKYIDGGDIQADKDIVIESEIVNSTMKTLGSVIIPRGRIVGREIVALRGIYVGRAGSKASTPTVLIAGENFRVKNKLSFRKNKIESIETELTNLKNFVDSQMGHNKTTFTYSQDELTKTLLNISKLEQKLQDLTEEVNDIEAKALSRAKKLVVVEETLYPKTTICLGDEKLIVDKECSGPIEAKIVDGKIKLSKVDTSQKREEP